MAKGKGAFKKAKELGMSGEPTMDALTRSAILNWHLMDRYSLELTHSFGMAELLEDCGIVYGDTEIDGVFTGDLDRDAAKAIRKLFREEKERQKSKTSAK